MSTNSESSRSSKPGAAKLSVLLPAEVIHDRVAELAEEINRHYADREVLVIIVLKGAFVFAADLIRRLYVPVTIDFIHLESYFDGVSSSGDVRIRSGLVEPVEGREVLVVEDIVDTGYSLDFLLNHLYTLQAADVKVCALLDKPSRRQVGVEPDFVGFTIPDVFVVGYGIDHAQRYRSLPDICVMEE